MAGRAIVTEWFRTPAAWFLLGEHLNGFGRPVTVWSGACGTGEEAYTAALLLRMRLSGGSVYATDVDRPNLEVARAGRYPGAALQRQVDEGRMFPSDLEDYFEDAADGHLRVRPDVRQLVTFGELRLGRDEPPACDAAILRNVWRHISPAEQRRGVEAVHRALSADGRLFLGGADLMEPNGYGLLTETEPEGLSRYFQEAEHPLLWAPR